jgi:hypothetical protein
MNEVDDFLARQGHVIEALTSAAIADDKYTQAKAMRMDVRTPDAASSSLICKALDAGLTKSKAKTVVEEYERSR